MEKILTINNAKVSFENEKNILEVIRKENIELPTFCYHSELSAYGSCRLCMIEVEGRGILPACSTPPEAGMKIKTNNEQIREMRKIIVELLLANHDKDCTACRKSESCQLQTLARKLGINYVRFKSVLKKEPKDFSTYSLVRDPSKCVLCGDCVRFCEEIQSVGAIGFANRGPKSTVCPSFGKNMNDSECVYCGQCVRVCPTGALTIKSEVSEVWNALSDPKKKVVVAIAPAVRAAIGEVFGIPGENGTEAAGKMVSALRSMGFARVFDISFSADMTIVEEANEFVERLGNGGIFPMFTSCCPAWIKFVEQYYPDMLPNLSSCRSPQGMFGSIARKMLPENIEVQKEDLVIVSVMPCTAKKFEARRPELSMENRQDIDYVLTTQELARMIEESGLNFKELELSPFDMPLGFKTGGGVIFGNSGGVTEAVLRNVIHKSADVDEVAEFDFVRGENGIRQAKVNAGGKELNIAIVHGLKNAREVVRTLRENPSKYDFVEVMACPGGCIGGAGQPVYKDMEVRKRRTKVLYDNDKTLELHKPQDNPYVQQVYDKYMEGKPGTHNAHKLLHAPHFNRKRLTERPFPIYKPSKEKKLEINVCFGTACIVRGAQKLLGQILEYIAAKDYKDNVEVDASFCFEKCSKGPLVKIADIVIEKCTIETAMSAIDAQMQKIEKLN